MARKTGAQTFGQVVRERRRKLDLTQQEVARRIKTSTPYVGHLEAGKRRPSVKVIARLAEVLGLEQRELFFLAHPGAVSLVAGAPASRRGAWEEFRRDERLRRLHGISAAEMNVLAQINKLGEVRSPRDFIYILNTIRHALGR
ncbi:MAG TPA: helix-turn-helix transcriptional regulator [Candidatus Binataceae bacterium]|jgi:transcriptional regulator with XRE-family HTH domain|nr:helix-turn-helix transcriptional regulator [Candidatus Binataceae bacterium]